MEEEVIIPNRNDVKVLSAVQAWSFNKNVSSVGIGIDAIVLLI